MHIDKYVPTTVCVDAVALVVTEVHCWVEGGLRLGGGEATAGGGEVVIGGGDAEAGGGGDSWAGGGLAVTLGGGERASGGGGDPGEVEPSVQVPQLEELEATRVPVVLLYVPVMLLMDTSEPVTAPLAVTWASQLLAAREPIASHEPGAPEAVLLYASVASGLPAPV